MQEFWILYKVAIELNFLEAFHPITVSDVCCPSLSRAGHEKRLEVTSLISLANMCTFKFLFIYLFTISTTFLEYHWPNYRKLIFLKSFPANCKITFLPHN